MAERKHLRLQWCEIVRIDMPQFLINSRHLACRYETASGVALTPGCYLAAGSCGAFPSYGRESIYLGPFATETAASLLRTSALAMQIVTHAAGCPLPANPCQSQALLPEQQGSGSLAFQAL